MAWTDVRDDLDAYATATMGADYTKLSAEFKSGLWTVIGKTVWDYIAGGGPATQLDADGTILDVNTISDGQYLKRVGATVVSDAGPTGAVSSVFGRAGAVTAQAGDYSVGEVTGAEATANKGAASGYCGLDAGQLVATANLGSGVAGATNWLRGDRSWTAPTAGDVGAQPADTDLSTLATGGTALQVPRMNSTGTAVEWVDASVVAGTRSVFFLDDTASDVGGYTQLEEAPIGGAEVIDSGVCNSGSGDVLIESYITHIGIPGTTLVPAGTWRFHLWRYVDSATGVSQIRFRVYRRTHPGGVETQLFTVLTGEINDLANTLQILETNQSAFTLTADERVVVKVYCLTTSVPNRTVSYTHNGTAHYSYVETPIVLPLDLATVQGTHPWTGKHTGTAGSGTLIAGIDNAGAAVELAFGNGAGDVCEGDDARLSDARTPVDHAVEHEPGGGDEMAVDAAVGTGSLRTLGMTTTAACPGNQGFGPTLFTPPPLVATLTWVNQSPGGGVAVAQAADRDGSLALWCGYRAGVNVSALVTAGTSIACEFQVVATKKNWASAGLCWYDGTKLEIVYVNCNTGVFSLVWHEFPSVTSFSTVRETVFTQLHPWDRLWLRLYDDGTYRRVQAYDPASQGWYDVATPVSRTNFMTPDRVGICVSPYFSAGSGSDGVGILVHSWVVT